ncbi:xyloglucan endotransglucosylase protein 7-like [Salvia miltiorrhiza]|uniref:xyloglucan endotransglucosylase protein 7-like n=1 Tax=Salvia miltiorrhiza TaxID=226208 RepID=UPI0025AC8723|nr:xyloglucan endotransglucosylase protein 7-like [Salvia miltiorrhiza]
MSSKRVTTLMLPRNFHFHPSRSHKLLPYFGLILFCIFIFKVDIIISQSASASRRNLDATRRHVHTLMIGNGTFHRNFIVSWGEGHVRVVDEGEELVLMLDKKYGAAVESKKEYLFARIDMQIKLLPRNSAGTVATYYLLSDGEQHDKIDLEFLGNSSGDPYTLHTNIYIKGKGEREQQFFLWFDPAQDFHTYSILWNPKCIIFYVDGLPIREFKNAEHLGVPFPKDQGMRLYSSFWNADDWATQGGRVKTDWTAAPFTVSYRNFSADGCIWFYTRRTSSCTHTDFSTRAVLKTELDERSREEMKRLQRDYMVYDYCTDQPRFPQGPPPECSIN